MGTLLAEIAEQPQVLARLLESELDAADAVAQAMRDHNVELVLFAARGSSDNAATYAKYLFGIRNRLPVALAAPSIYTRYASPPALHRALVVGVSQSGQSPDVVSVIQDARAQGLVTLAITNVGDSPLARAAEHVLHCHAGIEQSVAATKTYTAELAALALVSVLLSDDHDALQTLEAIPRTVASALALEDAAARAAQAHSDMRECVVIGRGYNYGTAFEVALKLRELTYTSASPYSSADFRHGPIAIIGKGYPVVLIAPSGRVRDDLHALALDLQTLGAQIITISDDAELLSLAGTGLRLPGPIPEWLSPIVAIVPAQMYAYHLALAKGIDPERPRGLSKVTETR